MRGGRSYLILAGYAFLVAATALIFYGSVQPSVGSLSAENANAVAARAGRGLWQWGCMAQALLLPLLVPAFTCGAITLERERAMLDLLLITQLSPFRICFGKFLAGAGLGVTLVLSSVPILALSFVLGGVSTGEFTGSFAILLGAVTASAALGLAISTFASSTANATTISYLSTGAWLIGIPLLSGPSWGGGPGMSGTDLVLFVALGTLDALIPVALGQGILLARGRPGGAWLRWTGFAIVVGLHLVLAHRLDLPLHPVQALTRLGGAGAPWSWMCGGFYLAGTLWLLLVATARVRALRGEV